MALFAELGNNPGSRLLYRGEQQNELGYPAAGE
jgi:hypothetical protein